MHTHTHHKPIISSLAAEMEAVAFPYSACPATSLLQVSMGCPHSCIVGEVVMGCKQLHLSPGEKAQGGARIGRKEKEEGRRRKRTVRKKGKVKGAYIHMY